MLKMEGKQEGSSYGGGVTVVKGDEAPDIYRLAPRIEAPRQHDGSTAAAAVGPEVPAVVGTTAAVPGASPDTVKKKRGRPRKYGPDGAALSPMPLSASIPLAGGDYPLWKQQSGSGGRQVEKIKKKHKFLFDSPGNKIALFVGGNFTPHLMTVNPGEDIAMKIMSFSQQGARAICVLSANGMISNVTLRQPTSCGGTLTYEGRFEILSLSGSYTPKENAGTVSRSGGMSVSLAGPDGRVLGGGLAGLLVAAGPVQVVVASFLPGHLLEPKPKKQRRIERAPTNLTAPSGNIVSREETDTSTHGGKEQSASVYNNGQNTTMMMMNSNSSTTETTRAAAFIMEESIGGLC